LSHKFLEFQRSRNLSPQAAGFDDVRVENFGDTAVIIDDGTIVQPPNSFDLKNRSVMFTPEAGGYRAARETVAFEDAVGSRLQDFRSIDGQSFDGDNGYTEVGLAGGGFTFYGVPYTTLFVGTNGYITFGRGDTIARISPSLLATDTPRIAPLWADHVTSKKGGVFYNRLDDRHLITWKKVSQPLFSGKSTFQVSLYDDGRVSFVYKNCKAHASLIGLSPGSSEDATPVDLSNAAQNHIAGPFFELFTEEKRLDVMALTRAFFTAHPDSFDTIYIWADFDYDNGLGVAHAFNIRNDIEGIGLPIFDRGPAFGSPARLATIITMGNSRSWPADPHERTAGLNSAINIVCHEQGHRWLSYVQFDGARGIQDNLLGRAQSHWSFLMDTRTREDGTFSSLMEGNAWNPIGSSGFVTAENAVNFFSPLDQYLMGLRSADEVGEISYLVTDPELTAFLRDKSPVSGFAVNGTRKKLSIQKIIDREGPRIPGAETAPREFRTAFILLVQRGTTPANGVLDKVATYRDALVSYFSVATGRRASLEATLAD
jgi:hypothetical protein